MSIAFKMLNIFFCFSLCSSLQAQTLAEQLNNLENKNTNINQEKINALKEIKEIVYQGYVDNSIVVWYTPKIEGVSGNIARISIRVDFKLNKEYSEKVSSTLKKYIKSQYYDETPRYEFSEYCYKQNLCKDQLIKPYTPDIWNLLSEEALGIKVVFLGETKFGIVVGQTLGTSGEVSNNAYYDFKFDVSKSLIKGNPTPVVSFVQYNAHWEFSNPSYVEKYMYKRKL